MRTSQISPARNGTASAQIASAQTNRKHVSRKRKSHPDDIPFARLTLSVVGLEFGQPYLSLTPHLGADRHAIFARQVAMYLLQTIFDTTAARTGELFGRHYSTVSHAIKVVDESREDEVFNRKLLKVEAFLEQSRATFKAAA